MQDDEAYARYDRMTARELFRSAGVSARLYKEFLEPILLVTLFAPGEQLSGERVTTPFRMSSALDVRVRIRSSFFQVDSFYVR